MKILVGKTIEGRSKDKILYVIMGNNVLDVGRILDYRIQIFTTNLGSACVIKVGDSEGSGR